MELPHLPDKITSNGYEADLRKLLGQGRVSGQTGFVQAQPVLTQHLLAVAAMIIWP